jgi:hypothetical protein
MIEIAYMPVFINDLKTFNVLDFVYKHTYGAEKFQEFLYFYNYYGMNVYPVEFRAQYYDILGVYYDECADKNYIHHSLDVHEKEAVCQNKVMLTAQGLWHRHMLKRKLGL